MYRDCLEWLNADSFLDLFFDVSMDYQTGHSLLQLTAQTVKPELVNAGDLFGILPVVLDEVQIIGSSQ